MTIHRYHLLLAAIATAPLLFSCSADDVAEPDESYIMPDGTKAVKVMFAFNVPYAGKGGTRMSAATVQEGVTAESADGYRGMQDIAIVPLPTRPLTTQNNLFPYTNVDLADATVQIESNYSANFYQDVSIPVGTSSFLFYGEALHGTLSGNSDMAANGIVDKPARFAGLGSTNDITFSLRQIATNEQLSQPKTELAELLNDVAATTSGTETNTAWSSLQNEAAGSDNFALGEAYRNYVAIGTARCGSGNAIRLKMQQLYNRVKRIQQTVNQLTNAEGYALATAILTSIENHFDATATGETGESETSTGFAKYAYLLSYKSLYDAATTTFPVAQGLPEGSAQLSFADGMFSYTAAHIIDGTVSGLTSSDKLCYPPSLQYFVDTPLRSSGNDYTTSNWPATNVNDWEDDDSWDDDNEWTPAVTQRTKSIALRNNIYYGVSRLVTTVRCATTTLEDNSEATEGANKTITIGSAADLTLDSEGHVAQSPDSLKGFLLTAIMMGGQPKTVGWNFLPTSTETGQASTTNREQVVCDMAMQTKTFKWMGTKMQQKKDAEDNLLYTKEDGTDEGLFSEEDLRTTPAMEEVEDEKTGAYPPLVLQASSADEATSALGVNYTMLFDNYNPAANATQEPARICLELENRTGVDFYGADGLIMNGQKFYLIGQLNTPAESSIQWVKGDNQSYTSRFPAYGKARAFVMDYTTRANLTIRDLKKAYVTIPDLRVPKLALGLSVDLRWTPGITYEADMNFE